MSTTYNPNPGPRARESRRMEEARLLLGTNVNPDGPPRLVYSVDTVILAGKDGQGWYSEVLKDRGEEVDGRNIKFKATDFYMNLIAERIMARTIP